MVDSMASNDMTRWASAVEEIDAWFSTLPEQPKRLTASEIEYYQKRHVVCGWRFKVIFGSQEIIFDLLLDKYFPWYAPRIALVGKSKFLEWPHIERDNFICLLPNIAEVDPSVPLLVVKNTLSSVADLIEASLTGANKEDFLSEFISYWGHTVEATTPEVRSLISATPESRFIKEWRGKKFSVVGDSESDVINWLRHYTGESSEVTIYTAGMIWLPQPLLPDAYPKNASDVLKIVRTVKDGEAILSKLVETTKSDNFRILFGSSTPYGPCYFSLVIIRPGGQYIGNTKRGADPVSKGFRPGHVPKDILIKRYIGNADIIRSKVIRVDSEWIHGRDSDPYHRMLRAKTVAIIGCGSLGSETAALLAQSGVGSLILIDPETLGWENIGRHHLGARNVDSGKALALARKLQTDYPHIHKIIAKSERWESAARESELLDSCDLIISTIGSWGSEAALNEWHIKKGGAKPVIYGWLEPYGLACHAVSIIGTDGCFACNLSEKGTPNFEVTTWARSTTRQEPACGVFYQPYGPLSLMNGACLISGLAIDCLVGKVTSSTHKGWIGEKKMLDELGGAWSESAQVIIADKPDGGFIYAAPYNNNMQCAWCGNGK